MITQAAEEKLKYRKLSEFGIDRVGGLSYRIRKFNTEMMLFIASEWYPKFRETRTTNFSDNDLRIDNVLTQSDTLVHRQTLHKLELEKHLCELEDEFLKNKCTVSDLEQQVNRILSVLIEFRRGEEGRYAVIQGYDFQKTGSVDTIVSKKMVALSNKQIETGLKAIDELIRKYNSYKASLTVLH